MPTARVDTQESTLIIYEIFGRLPNREPESVDDSVIRVYQQLIPFTVHIDDLDITVTFQVCPQL
jgi:hypothetical protein